MLCSVLVFSGVGKSEVRKMGTRLVKSGCIVKSVPIDLEIRADSDVRFQSESLLFSLRGRLIALIHTASPTSMLSLFLQKKGVAFPTPDRAISRGIHISKGSVEEGLYCVSHVHEFLLGTILSLAGVDLRCLRNDSLVFSTICFCMQKFGPGIVAE